MKVIKAEGRRNLAGLIKRKEIRRRRKKKSPKKRKTVRMRPAGRKIATAITMRALRLDAIRQKDRRLTPSIA